MSLIDRLFNAAESFVAARMLRYTKVTGVVAARPLFTPHGRWILARLSVHTPAGAREILASRRERAPWRIARPDGEWVPMPRRLAGEVENLVTRHVLALRR